MVETTLRGGPVYHSMLSQCISAHIHHSSCLYPVPIVLSLSDLFPNPACDRILETVGLQEKQTGRLPGGSVPRCCTFFEGLDLLVATYLSNPEAESVRVDID